MQVARGIAGAVVLFVLGTVSTAQGQTVSFSGINDAVPSKFFDAATSVPDPADGNRLIIGFNVGRDPATWRTNEFKASTASFSHTSAMDTISFVVEAPAGYYISKVIYAQRGFGSALGTGRASGGTQWVVGDAAQPVGMFSTSPTFTRIVDLTGLNLTVVPVSITNSLFAFATSSLGSATVAVTAADVRVEILPLTY